MKKIYLIPSLILCFIALMWYNSSIFNSSEDLSYKWKTKINSAQQVFTWRNEMLKNVESGEVNSSDYYQAIEQANFLKNQIQTKSSNSLNIEWVNRGPDSQGGRTRAILFDKDNPNLIYAGGISGGLYKTTDGAQNWQRINSYNGNNASIMSLAQTISGTIFVGTGEYLESPGLLPDGNINNSSITGDGMYKSNNGGNTWVHINATNVNASVESSGNTNPTYYDDWAFVSVIAAHPTNTNLLLAGTKTGLKISLNAEALQPSFITIAGMNGRVSDVKITNDGQEVWCAMNGKIYFSDDFQNNFSTWTLKNPTSNSSRAQLAISNVDSNGDYFVYVSSSDSPGCLSGIYKSENRGNSWTQIVYPGGSDPFSQPSGNSGCQGWYDHALTVNPVDKDKIYIGGITLYTWSSGSAGLKRADVIDSEDDDRFAPNYLHADKHIIVFSPHDPTGNTMIIGHDGGMSISYNANSGFPDQIAFREENKNYITLQCYSIGSGKYGELIAGSQDNGTQYVNYKGISPKAAIEVSGGDGVSGAELSNLDPSITFSGYVNGVLYRSFNKGTTSTSFLSDVIDPAGCGHITCDELDVNSGEQCSDVREEGQSFIFPFYLMETNDRLSPKQTLYVKARDEEIELPSGDIELIQETIDAGDVTSKVKYDLIPGLDLSNLDLVYVSNETLNPGDEVFFENKFDAKFFVPSNCDNNFFVCTNPLQKGTAPKFSSVNIVSQSVIERMDASADGDMLVGVGANKIIIMQGWDAYDEVNNPNSVYYSTYTLGSVNSSKIVGVSVSKQDKNIVMVTLAGYGGANKVYLSINATDSNPVFNSIQNDLPIMPVYSCLVDKANSNRLLIGTELGIWSSDDSGQHWVEENNGMGGRFPIYAIRQEWMNKFDCDLISVGSFGAGMFTSISLMDCPQKNNLIWGEPEDATPIAELSVPNLDLVLYPNPSSSMVNISFKLIKEEQVSIQAFDALGKKLFSKQLEKMPQGKSSTRIDVSHWSKGNYFIVLKTNSGKKISKILTKN